jgi:adenine phosphoribosyltransferase
MPVLTAGTLGGTVAASQPMSPTFDLDSVIRKVPGFPRPGVLFYDVTGILGHPEAFRFCIDEMERIYRDVPFDAVAAVEARGFVFASPFAIRRSLPLVLLRKKGKLPGKTLQAEITLEYGVDTLEVHVEDIRPGARVALVDDLVATGGTLRGAASLIEQGGGTVAAIFGVIGLPFLSYADVLRGYRVDTLIDYHGE